jgi:hypothetical protein
MNAQRGDERRAASRSREDVREVDQQSRGLGPVILVVSVLTLVPMLRIVPVVKGIVMVFGDLPRQEVQVFSRRPV